MARVSGITQSFQNNGSIVLGFNSINFLDCGCIGKCSFPNLGETKHPDMKQWRLFTDKSVAYYLPSWINYFDSK